MEERARIQKDSQSTKKNLTLVYFLGGVTYAEISAIRFLSEKDPNTDYVIATTHLVNGDTLLAEVVKRVQNSLNVASMQESKPKV